MPPINFASLLITAVSYLHRRQSIRSWSRWERYSRWQRGGPTWPRTRNIRWSRCGHSRRQSSRRRASEHGRHGRHGHWRYWRTRKPSCRHYRWWWGCVGWCRAKRDRWRGWWHSTPAPSVRGLWGWLLPRHISAAQPRNKGWDESTHGCQQSVGHHRRAPTTVLLLLVLKQQRRILAWNKKKHRHSDFSAVLLN